MLQGGRGTMDSLYVRVPLKDAILLESYVDEGSEELKAVRKVKVEINDLSFKDIERVGLYDQRPISKAKINARHYNKESYIEIDDTIYKIRDFNKYQDYRNLWVYDLFLDLQTGPNLSEEW